MTELELDQLCRMSWDMWGLAQPWDSSTDARKANWRAMIWAVVVQPQHAANARPSFCDQTAMLEQQHETNLLLVQQTALLTRIADACTGVPRTSAQSKILEVR